MKIKHPQGNVYKFALAGGEKTRVPGFYMHVGGWVGWFESCQPPRRLAARGGALLTAPCV